MGAFTSTGRIERIYNTLNLVREIIAEEALMYNSTPLYNAKHELDDLIDTLEIILDRDV